jgi:hypothetical protein
MLNLLLAAALMNAVSRPLFQPPKALHHLSRDPLTAARMQRSRMEFLTEYRASVHRQIHNLTFSRSIVITIARAPSFGMDAQSYATARLDLMARHPGYKIVASRSSQICEGRRGWLAAFTRAGSDEFTQEMFAQGAGDRMYIATLRYPQSVGDVYHAGDSLRTLCPPPPAVPEQPVGRLPFKPPAGWGMGHEALQMPEDFSAVGTWLHLAAHSPFMESLILVKAPALPDGVSVADEARAMTDGTRTLYSNFQLQTSRAQTLCNTDDGWYTEFSAIQNGHAYTVERMYAFGDDASYILSYTHLRSDPPAGAAHKALESLCLPSPPSPSPVQSVVPSASPTP